MRLPKQLAHSVTLLKILKVKFVTKQRAECSSLFVIEPQDTVNLYSCFLLADAQIRHFRPILLKNPH